VIGGHREDRVLAEAPRDQLPPQAPDLGVGVGDLAVVGRPAKRSAQGAGVVGRVRIVVVDEEEERRPQPRGRGEVASVTAAAGRSGS